jgi:ribose/xylose/arabinose/galactoside ABC-type transport system permease subunit
MQELGLIIVTLLLGLFLWTASGTVPVKDAKGNALTHSDGTAIVESKFLRLDNLVPSVFTVMSWMAVMAIGQTIVVISGGIDISVGSIMGLSAFLTALVLQGPAELTDKGWVWYGYDWRSAAPAWMQGMLLAPLTAAILGTVVALGVGLICGLINGLLVVGLRMHPFIVTLATLSIFRWVPLRIGVNLGNNMNVPFSGGKMLAPGFTDRFISHHMDFSFYGGQITRSYEFVPLIIMLICLALGWLYLRHMVWGRETYAVGGNEEAARYSGIRVAWVKIRVYAISGVCAGIGGLLICGYSQAANTGTGLGFELTVVAAAVVGGASLDGGRGTALGAVLGMLVLTLVENGIAVLGRLNLGFISFKVETLDTKLIYGMAIILAVVVDMLSTRLLGRRSARIGVPAK